MDIKLNYRYESFLKILAEVLNKKPEELAKYLLEKELYRQAEKINEVLYYGYNQWKNLLDGEN